MQLAQETRKSKALNRKGRKLRKEDQPIFIHTAVSLRALRSLRLKSSGAELVANFTLLFLCVPVVKSKTKSPLNFAFQRAFKSRVC